ncbi:hypothetical protein BHE74_00037972 [Ensete ventricosum]|nr:hypothetical protein BHE74_00037972 [Ensete ventricosum]RZR89511.1 hypothetical protein BHM03_00017242 [Ensete ventricosum]
MPLTRQQKDLNITDLESSAMTSEELIDEMLEAFKTRKEDKFGLLAEFNLGRPSSPRRSQHGESSDRKQNASKRGEHATDSLYPRMRIDFPRWEDGHPTGWISHAERYFRYHRTLDTSMVDIAAIHLEGDAIKWYDWFEHTHEIPTWRQFKSELQIRFRPSTKGLCWHCDEPWSRDHRCRKGRLLMIESIEESEHEDADLESEREDTEEDP